MVECRDCGNGCILSGGCVVVVTFVVEELGDVGIREHFVPTVVIHKSIGFILVTPRASFLAGLSCLAPRLEFSL